MGLLAIGEFPLRVKLPLGPARDERVDNYRARNVSRMRKFLVHRTNRAVQIEPKLDYTTLGQMQTSTEKW